MKKRIILTALICIFQLSVFSQSITVEAESGSLNGTTTATSDGVTYVTGLDSDGDSFTITVNAPAKGTYVVLLRYRSEYKIQDLLLNGVFVSNITLTNTSNTWQNIELGNVMLNAGNNTVTIRKNWGWSDFDTFTFTLAAPHDYSITDASPINPNTNQKTKEVYSWLRSHYGTNIISGQTSYWNQLIAIAQKTPVIRAFDFQHYTVGYPYLWDNGGNCHTFGWEDDGSTQEAINWYNSTNGKGIVTFQWHWHPALNSQVGANTFYTNQTTFDVTKAVTVGTAEYNSIIRDIDSIATQLKRLQTAGVPVLWRPLHEAGGEWFWWGAKGATACLQLYDIMYDRLTYHHQLNNLIWVWSSPEKDWYPGNAKVDIFGYDSYPGNFVYASQKTMFDDMFKTCSGKKMIAMTENGPLPSIDNCISDDAMWLYFSTWDDHVVEGNSSEHVQQVYAHSHVITLDEVVGNNPATITPSSPITNANWVATDALGRTLPDYTNTGASKSDKYVGMFYYIWLGTHGNTVYDITKILKQYPSDPLSANNPGWGGYGAFHFWGEPEMGYYRSDDPWVIRRNMIMLANAGVDFIFFDVTNAVTYLNVVDTICRIITELRTQGIAAPYITFTTNSSSGQTINNLYNDFYSLNKYPDTWFRWQGKPLVMGDFNDPVLRSDVKNFFTMKKSWVGSPHSIAEENHWPWLAWYPQGWGWSGNASNKEQISVSVAFHPENPQGKSFSAISGGQPSVDSEYKTTKTNEGVHFAEQWNRAHAVNPQIVMVTQWNEWVAQKFTWDKGNGSYAGRPIKNGDCYFVDVFSLEFNRDIEPMKGGYTDSYYYQLVSNVRKYKGMVVPQMASSPKTIAIDGIFTEWADVTPVFTDPQNDTKHRNYPSYDLSVQLTNTTGRNDIIASRTTIDGSYIYFYIKTAANITPYTNPNWMMVYLNTDRNKTTGWEGFDYVINMGVTSATETTIKQRVGNSWTTVGSATYRVVGNQMEIAVPRSVLEYTADNVAYYYQIFDNPQVLDNIEDNFIHGESAPDRRFNYSYANSKAYTSPITTIWHFDNSNENWTALNHMSLASASSIATATITGSDPYMHSPDNLNLNTSDFKYIVVSMKNNTAATTAELFWTTTTSHNYEGAKRVQIPIIPNDTKLRTYVIDLSQHSLWTGTIKQIRLDPTTQVNSGTVEIDFIKFVETYPTITPHIQINNEAWIRTNTATLCAGGSAVFGPHPTDETGWIWTGPNGFSASTREITFTNITTNKTGNYIATYTDAEGNEVTQIFSILVHELPTAVVSTSAATLGSANGSITFTFPNNPAHTTIALSINNGATYTSVANTSGSKTFSNLASGIYKLWAQWENQECPVYIGEYTLGAAQIIPLVQGWNVISVSVIEKGNANEINRISTLFKNLDVKIVKDANGFWKPNQPEQFNSLQTLEPGKGYLVYMNVAGTITIYGTSVETNNFSSLQNGWQLIGYPGCDATNTTSCISKPISDYFNTTNCGIIKNFDGSWTPNGTMNSIQNFEVGKGYWFYK